MLATFAFDVCHDVYRAAREVIDTKIPTLNMESSGKYTWHPDRLPRLGEYVCDFPRAGERALGDASQVRASADGDVSRVLPRWRGISSGAASPGNQRVDMDGLVGGDSHASRTRTDSFGNFSAFAVFS